MGLIIVECDLFFILNFLLFQLLELDFILFNIINETWLITFKFNDLFFVVKLSLIGNFYVADNLLDFDFVNIDFLFSICQFKLALAFVWLDGFLLFLDWLHRARFGLGTEFFDFIFMLRKLFIQTLDSFIDSIDFFWIISGFGIYWQCW